MTQIGIIQQTSLVDPTPESAIADAVNWVSGLLFGPLATVITVIAIAWVGFAMLSGRIDIKRGLSVVFGCFLLFGAKGVADGLRSVSESENAQIVSTVPLPPAFSKVTPAANPTNAYDPYAGAAVMTPSQ